MQLDKNLLFSTFGVDSFFALENHTQAMAPSMVEYYLNDLISLNSDSNTYINKSYVQHTINLDEYYLYLDYNDETYIEFVKDQNEDYETASFW